MRGQNCSTLHSVLAISMGSFFVPALSLGPAVAHMHCLSVYAVYMFLPCHAHVFPQSAPGCPATPHRLGCIRPDTTFEEGRMDAALASSCITHAETSMELMNSQTWPGLAVQCSPWPWVVGWFSFPFVVGFLPMLSASRRLPFQRRGQCDSSSW